MNPKVDFYFTKDRKWQQEIEGLRKIVLDCGLTEELKWGVPCYSHNNKNIGLIHVFKEYCALLFFKGALLNDADGILIQQTKNTQATRQIRFTDRKEILAMAASLKAYIFEAIEVERSGLNVKFKKTSEYEVPDEFKLKLKAMPALKTAFDGLTPGRKRAYILYFSAAKQSQTRAARIEKCMQQIFDGKGLDGR